MRRYEEKYFKWLCVVFFSMHLVFVRPSKMLNSSPHFPLPLLPSSPSLNSDGVCPHFIVSLCLSPDMLSFLSPRPPGTEAATTPMRTWRDEKKWRRSWRRGSTPWCVRVDALIIRSAPSFPPPQFSRAGLGPKETALILAGLVETGTWRYVPLPCQLSENRNQRLQRGNRRRDRVERDYFIYRSRSRLPLSPWSSMRRLEAVISADWEEEKAADSKQKNAPNERGGMCCAARFRREF